MKGSIEILLLTLLAQKDCYGYELAKELRKRSGDQYQMNEGTLYPALKRMGTKEYVTSYWMETMEGTKRKYYSITDQGREEVRRKLKSWNQIHRLIAKCKEGFV